MCEMPSRCVEGFIFLIIMNIDSVAIEFTLVIKDVKTYLYE